MLKLRCEPLHKFHHCGKVYHHHNYNIRLLVTELISWKGLAHKTNKRGTVTYIQRFAVSPPAYNNNYTNLL
jgi:hypothetical protein